MIKKTLFSFFFLAFTFCFTLQTQALAANYGSIDAHALSAPIEVEKDMATLVKYLTENLNTAEEKSRAIAAWIAYHVDYDDYRQKLAENSKDGKVSESLAKSDAFVVRKGTSFDFANLFKEMATMAGLKAAVIKGNYKGPRGSSPSAGNKGASSYQDYRSTWYWNAVSDGTKWNLLDTAAAATGLNSEAFFTSQKDYAKDMKKREEGGPLFYQTIKNSARRNKRLKDDNEWFFVKPADMIKSHFPSESDWQLLKSPMPKSSFFEQ